jgi:NADH-quinone oxidoreductase subunit N
MKYFLMGAFATGILLFGMAMIYGATGQIQLSAIWTNVIADSYNHNLMNVGIIMLIVAFCFKISAAPFHFWSPDVYDGTPTLFTSFMATVVKTAAFATFFKLFLTCFTEIGGQWTPIIAAIAALSMVLANVTAIYQRSFKRMMAYSSISHAGYLLLALISLNFKEGQSAILLYLSAYSMATIAAFTVFTMIQQQTGRSDFEVFNGLGKRKRLLAVTMTIAMLSLAGIPLTAGFFGKYYLFSIAIHQYMPLVIIAILNSAISIYYYFRVIVAMWFKESEHHAISLETSPIYSMVAIVTSMAIIVIGILPSIIIELFW